MKPILNMVIIVIFFLPSLGYAEFKEIIAEGTYNMGDGETPSIAESRALLNAKRIAIEEAGTYIESYSKVKNFQLTHDEIQVLASGVMEVTILDKKRTVIESGFRFWVKIKAKVSTDKIEEMTRKVREKWALEDVVNDFKQLQEEYRKRGKEIEGLKRNLAEVKKGTEREKIEAKIAEEEKIFRGRVWFEHGKNELFAKKYDGAIEAFSEAIISDPQYAPAYLNRAFAHLKKSQYSKEYSKKGYEKAIDDLNRAISLDSNYNLAYLARGLAYSKKGHYDKAIGDFKRLIILNPSSAAAYFGLGIVYSEKGNYAKAIKEYNNAIGIDPNFAQAYLWRGKAHFRIKQHERALQDFNKAITIDPNDAFAYHERAALYFGNGQFNKAFEDSGKAIALEPNFAAAYTIRGIIYTEKGQRQKAIDDLKRACDLGDEWGCEVLSIFEGKTYREIPRDTPLDKTPGDPK